MERKKNKKRITHIGNDLDNEYEATHQGFCLDLVDSIMESMDTGIKTVGNTELAREVNQSKATLNSSNDLAAQAYKIADAKFKKFSVTRKFPLMEKSQKVLKQLKHNRSMPKPRAHLQVTEKSAKEISVPPIVSQNKKKPFKLNEKAQKTSITLSEYPHPNMCAVDSNLKEYIDKQRKIAREKSSSNKDICTKVNPFQPDSVTPDISQTTADDNRDDSADLSHTTDSEYEKFIEKNKPKLKKKTKKIKKPKSKTSLKTQTTEKNFVEQYDSDFDNSNASESAYKKVKHAKPKTKSQNQCIDNEMEKETVSKKVSLENRKKQVKKKPVTVQNNSNVQNRPAYEKSDSGKKAMGSRQVKSNFVPIDNAKERKTSFANKSKSFNNLQRSSSSESLVEQYDSNFCQSDSSDDNQGFNDTVTDTELVKSNSAVKDNMEIFSTSSKDTDNSKNNLGAIVDNELNFQKEADFIPKRYSLRSKNFNSEKVANVEISPAEAASNSNNASNSTVQSEVEDHTGDSLPETSAINNVTELNFANSNAQVPPPNKVCDDLKDARSSKKDSRPFIPFEEFCGSENNNLIEKSQKSDSDESDIEIIEIVNRKNTEPGCNSLIYSTPNSKNVLNSNPVDVDASEVEIISDTVRCNHTSIDTDSYKNVVCKIEPSALDDGRKGLASNLEAVKQETAEKHDPVYMTNICQDIEEDNVQLGDNCLETSVGSTSAPSSCVANSVGSSSNALTQYKSAVEDDDIMVIEPNCEGLNIKQEKEEDDIIIEFEVKAPCKENIDNPVANLICKRKTEHQERSENNIKSEYPLSCKIPKIASDQINASLIEKELALFKFPEQSTSVKAPSRSNFEFLVSKYKMEFNVYKEIRQTEASVEAGLKLVEAHQAQKLREIRLEIDKVLKNDPQFDKIYNQFVKEKESFEIAKIHPSPKSSLEFSSENSNDSKPDVIAIANTVAPNPPLTFIKIENNDLSSLNISSTPFAVDHSNLTCKVEEDTLESSDVSHSAPVDEKPEFPFLGQKCNSCGKDAVAACQRCAKVFFCSNKCGKQFWNDGHKDVCLS